MAWLPYEDAIAEKSEEVILKYNPNWTGAGEIRKPMWVPDKYLEYFDITHREEFEVKNPFTRDSWHGRMRACRGVGASLSESNLLKWDKEHRNMLEQNVSEQFEVLHFVSLAELTLC